MYIYIYDMAQPCYLNLFWSGKAVELPTAFPGRPGATVGTLRKRGGLDACARIVPEDLVWHMHLFVRSSEEMWPESLPP